MRSPLYLHAWLQNFYPSSQVLSPSTEEQMLQNQAMDSIPPPRNDGDKPDDGFVAVNVAELVAAADRPPATPRVSFGFSVSFPLASFYALCSEIFGCNWLINLATWDTSLVRISLIPIANNPRNIISA